MPKVDRHTRWWLGTVMTIVLANVALPAMSQDADVVEDRPQPPKRPTFGDREFDNLIYGEKQNTEQFRSRFESVLDKRIKLVNEYCKLSEEQKKKLYLAGKGDIKRLLDRIEGKRARLHQLSQENRQQFNQFIRELVPLRTAIHADLFGDNSLFAKIIKAILTDEQLIEYEKVEKELWLIRNRHTLDVILEAESRRLKLSPQQAERLTSRVVEEIRPVHDSSSNGSSVGLQIMNSLVRIPDDKLQPIFNKDQWERYSQRVESFRSRFGNPANNNIGRDSVNRQGYSGR